MWSGLVTDKLMQCLSCFNCCAAADIPRFPTTSSSVEPPNWDQITERKKSSCKDHHHHHRPKETLNYKLFAGTWNVGGAAPPDDLNLEEWLNTRNDPCDIYVLGFQEIVPLSARNVLGRRKSSRKITSKWNSLIGSALNKDGVQLTKRRRRRRRDQMAKVGDHSEQRLLPVTRSGGCGEDFHCILRKQMVGIFVSVWVRGDLRRCVRNLAVCCVGCGIMGCLGNKGSISVRFCLHETSFCFVCCHLASGNGEGDQLQRSSDAMKILSRTSFPHHAPPLHLPRKILDHDRVILLGDLNYRISLPDATTLSLVEQKNWDMLLEKDQLRAEASAGQVFDGWLEGTVAFAPTYKYYPNSDEYYGRIKGKKRAPAWCDRIIWRGDGIKQKQYGRWESRLSDHRPVRSVFSVEAEVVRGLKSLRIEASSCTMD
ncbi:type IV inositol polyphosphate 5-phosphatase 9-like [Canna indica]|uniref:Type IV inositol polyphosphate 5-phosphatase 9-like n=1 Tax=Canna indica TaxID=4628 RepID=A0AAQ3KNX3_9LILI|nr:type IV inositol polyphosphate 5-phosphatase 9-like [Canna indica]